MHEEPSDIRKPIPNLELKSIHFWTKMRGATAAVIKLLVDEMRLLINLWSYWVLKWAVCKFSLKPPLLREIIRSGSFSTSSSDCRFTCTSFEEACGLGTGITTKSTVFVSISSSAFECRGCMACTACVACRACFGAKVYRQMIGFYLLVDWGV